MAKAKEPRARIWIAVWIVVLGGIAVGALGITVIVAAAPGAPRERASQLVLSSVLPVFGTWVGTVLAYYFARENFEAASRSSLEFAKLTLDQKLSSIPVRKVMIPRDKIKCLVLSPSETGEERTMKQLRDGFGDMKRLPVFLAADQARYIVHRSSFDAIVAEQASKGRSATEIDSLTIGAVFKENPKWKVIFESTFALVKESASLADAKLAMETTPNCQDVFVTSTGRPTEAVSGWVTNNEITANSSA